VVESVTGTVAMTSDLVVIAHVLVKAVANTEAVHDLGRVELGL